MIAVAEAREGLLDRVVETRGSLRALCLMRLLFGAIVVLHLLPDLLASRTPVERFHVPWWSWLPVPGAGAYRALLWLGLLAGVAMLVGVATRAATATALAVVSYLLFVDLTGFGHNRAFLVWMLGGLALLPTDRALALDARRRRTRSDEGFLWPVLLLRIVASSVYLTSGGTKLLDPDWRSGLVLWDRTVRMQHLIPFDGWVHDLLVSRWFHAVLAPSAIAVELFLAVGLWHRRTRLAAIWVAILFHGSIEITASVQTFSYSALAALLLWVTPRTRDRVLFTGSTRVAGVVRALDWLHRFDVRPGEPGIRVVDRDGSVRSGRAGALLVATRLPLTFWFAAPVLVAVRARR